MIDLKNINIELKNKKRKLLNDFNFTLNEGDKAVVIGEEGNGKSTLLKMIYDKKLIESYCWFSGKIIKNENYVGYLEQEINKEWYNCSIYEYLAKQSPVMGYYNFDYTKLVSIFSDMMLDPKKIQSKQKIKTLSGGEKIKIQLAKLLVRDPDVLLLDEPTNDLDLDTLRWLEDFIITSEIPIMFISHDETLIEKTANIIIHLEQIKKKNQPRHSIEKMEYKDYLQKRKKMLKKQEQIARDQRAEHKSTMKQWRQVYNKVKHQQETISRKNPAGARLLKKKMKSVKAQEKRFKKKKKDFLEIPDVEEAINFTIGGNINISNKKTVLSLSMDELKIHQKILSKNIKLVVTGPEHIAIIGDNGVGKTTLLKEIYIVLQKRKDINVSYMPQNYSDKLNYNITPLEFLVPDGNKEEETKACTYMGNMKFTYQEMKQKIGKLSGGQKAKLLLLEMILNNYDVLLMDEPTRNFSPLSNSVLREGLAQFKGVIISISHDRKYIKEVCNKTYKLTKEGLQRCNI